MDTKYAKYFLNHRLLLRDGFFTYYLQSQFLSADDIPDVQTLVFDWPEDTEQWLLQCADFDHFTTFNNLRDFLSEEVIRFGLHLMDDSRVLLAAVRCITNERVPIVIQPNHGWAVKTDPNTGATTIPIVVEAAPDADSLINELRHELNALVAEQQKKYREFERQLAENNDFLEYSKTIGGGLYDFTESAVTSAVDTIKAAYVVKKTLDNLATSLKIATARSLYYGTLDPLKNQIDAIVKTVSTTYEQVLEYRAIITTLFNDEETAELLTDFAKRYYEATHPLELTRFGVSGNGDIILTIILVITTAGVGAAANAALKVKHLEKAASLLLKLAKIFRRIGPRYRLPKLNKKTGMSAKNAAKSAINKKKGITDIESPKKKDDLVDGDGKKDYGDRCGADVPKTTPKSINPLDDPKIAKEIQRDPNAVNGYSPKPESSLDKFKVDWSNPKEVEFARSERIKYLEKLKKKKKLLEDEVVRLRKEGMSMEDIARKKVNQRNQERIDAYLKSDNLEGLKVMKKRNLIEYGRAEGPTADQLFKRKGSWDDVVFGSVKSSAAMDVLVGLY